VVVQINYNQYLYSYFFTTTTKSVWLQPLLFCLHWHLWFLIVPFLSIDAVVKQRRVSCQYIKLVLNLAAPKIF